LELAGDNNDQFLKGQIFEKKYILEGLLQELGEAHYME